MSHPDIDIDPVEARRVDYHLPTVNFDGEVYVKDGHPLLSKSGAERIADQDAAVVRRLAATKLESLGYVRVKTEEG